MGERKKNLFALPPEERARAGLGFQHPVEIGRRLRVLRLIYNTVQGARQDELD
jgi:Fe-S cluster assembly ATPase SufC